MSKWDRYKIEGLEVCGIFFFGPLVPIQVLLFVTCTRLLQPQLLTATSYEYSYLLQPFATATATCYSYSDINLKLTNIYQLAITATVTFNYNGWFQVSVLLGNQNIIMAK